MVQAWTAGVKASGKMLKSSTALTDSLNSVMYFERFLMMHSISPTTVVSFLSQYVDTDNGSASYQCAGV